MAIIHFPGYISLEKAAEFYKVQVRTIHNRLRRKDFTEHLMIAVKVDGVLCINDPLNQTPPPAGIALSSLEWLPKFARRRKLNIERVYEDVMKDELDGVIIAGRVCVIRNAPKTLHYISAYKRIRKEKRHK